MLRFLKRLVFGDSRNSGSLAKSRLHFVLVQDRTGLTGDQMALFRSELVNVIDRYFVIDKQAFDVSYKRDNETTTLLINSPVIVRRQDSVGGKVGARRSDRKKEARGEAAPQSVSPVSSQSENAKEIKAEAGTAPEAIGS